MRDHLARPAGVNRGRNSDGPRTNGRPSGERITAPSDLSVRAGVSAPSELFWMVVPVPSVTYAPFGWQTSDRARRVRARVFDEFHMDWPDEGVGKSAHVLELLALAVATDTYEDDTCERLAERIAEGSWGEALLRTESWRDRVVVQRRMARLEGDARLRGHYATMVSRAWSAMDAFWKDVLPSCREAAAKALALNDIESALGEEHFVFDLLRELVGLEEVLVTGHFSARLGGHGIDLDRHTLAAGISTHGVRLSARPVAESLARTVEPLSDPTRAALLLYLMEHDRSVTHLARVFGLAKSTISRHVARLEESGLVTRRSHAGRLQMLAAREDALIVIAQKLALAARTVDQGEDESAEG